MESAMYLSALYAGMIMLTRLSNIELKYSYLRVDRPASVISDQTGPSH